MGSLVLIDINAKAGVATLTLNRPERLNALNGDLIREFGLALDELEGNPGVRALVIRGQGRAFCSGQDAMDLEAGAASGGASARIGGAAAPLAVRLHGSSKPTVAAVHGVAIGAGLDLALACDYRIAETSAKMGDWHIRRGYVPSASAYFLPRLVGEAKALEMLTLGTLVSGQEASELGIVNHVVAEGSAYSTAVTLANDLAKGPRVAMAYLKHLVRASSTLDLTSAMQLVTVVRSAAAPAREPVEGMLAYREKRDPDWLVSDR